MEQRRPRYLSYMLRLWQTSDGEKRVWRASLETPGTRKHQGFGCLEDLFEFLQAQTESGGGDVRDKGDP